MTFGPHQALKHTDIRYGSDEVKRGSRLDTRHDYMGRSVSWPRDVDKANVAFTLLIRHAFVDQKRAIDPHISRGR